MFVPYGDKPIKNPPDHALIPHLLAYTSLQKKEKERKAQFAKDIKKKRTELKYKNLKRSAQLYLNEQNRPQKTVPVTKKEGPSIKLMKTQVSKLYDDKKKLVTENNKLKNQLRVEVQGYKDKMNYLQTKLNDEIGISKDWEDVANDCKNKLNYLQTKLDDEIGISKDWEDVANECKNKMNYLQTKLADEIGISKDWEDVANKCETTKNYYKKKMDGMFDMANKWQTVAETCQRERKKTQLNKYDDPGLSKPKRKKVVKKVVKKNTGGLASWQVFLKNYRSQNPNMPFREAQMRASALFKKR